MQCCAVLGFLLVICLPITAEPVGSSPEENKAQYPAVAASFNLGKPVREGALLQLADFVKHGDTLLKERLQASYTDLREELKQGDTFLNNQLKDGDSRLKQELDEDVAWLKQSLDKVQDRLNADLAEEEKRFTSQMSDLKEAFAKLQDNVKAWKNTAETDALKQQVDEVQAELGRTRHLLQTTQSELGSTKEKMGTLETELGSTKEKMGTLETELGSTKELLNTTKHKAESTEQELLRTQQELQAAQAEVDSLKAEVDFGLQSQADTGSTFTRWGNTECPDNTSLVYSGVAGGSHYTHTGGASNYLCLVTNPQLDANAVSNAVNFLYGVEYEAVQGHHNQDAVCSVCRAPQATTVMVPATVTCPDGWSSQYKGHLMSGYFSHKGRFEYVCVDDAKEHADGGEDNSNGALFYYVKTQCGSLPCPPYTGDVITTCVVCSK